MTCKCLPFVTITDLQSQPSHYSKYCLLCFIVLWFVSLARFFHITEVINQQGSGREKYFPRNSYGKISFDLSSIL